MVAKVNAGNTPFRFMPMLWAHGSGALDEAEPNPEYKASMINNEGGIAALQAWSTCTSATARCRPPR
jgi:multiple sugar transport system substrate-binding protein